MNDRSFRCQDQQGVALILGLFFAIIVMGITISGSLALKSHQTTTRTNFVTHGQARAFARSGLTEALGWLRQQTTQPVLNFEPVRDTVVTPQILDTAEPDVGLVREFPITGALWGRYEVWKRWAADPDPDRLAWRQQMQCEDVSNKRNGNGSGAVWRLRSVGYVFRRVDGSVAFDQMPNQVLGQEILETEARRLNLNTPGQGAMNVGDGNSCHINTYGRIIGGSDGAGIYYPQGTGTPTTGPAADNRVTGSPALSPATSYDDSYGAVFGIGYDDLRAMADLVVTNESQLPVPLPEYGLVVMEGNSFTLDNSRPLRGTAIVVCRGHLTLLSGNNSNFSGLLYVEGNLTVRAPSEIRGSVVCTGDVTVQGATDYATIYFDSDVLDALRSRFSTYRQATAITRPVMSER